jgi:hypothetical protein
MNAHETRIFLRKYYTELHDEWFNRPLYYILHEEWERCCNDPKGDPLNRCHLRYKHPKLITQKIGDFFTPRIYH